MRNPFVMLVAGLVIGLIIAAGAFIAGCGNLEHFGLIVPCGIIDKSVTSLELLTGRAVPMEDVETAVAGAFSEVFGRDILP